MQFQLPYSKLRGNQPSSTTASSLSLFFVGLTTSSFPVSLTIKTINEPFLTLTRLEKSSVLKIRGPQLTFATFVDRIA